MYYPPVDPDTGLDALVKQPAESRIYSMDFANILNGSDILSIAGIAAVGLNATASSNPVTLSQQRVNGTLVSVRIAGGSHGGNYRLTVTVNDSNSSVLNGDGILYVREL
jgi:hypothetical protein